MEDAPLNESPSVGPAAGTLERTWEPLDPDRPDYVYAMASYRLSRGQMKPAEEDPAVHSCIAFLQRLGEADGPIKRSDAYSAHYRAYILRRAPDSRKHVVEAGVLAGVEHAEIAGYVGVSPDVSAKYEEMYFRVRERRDQPGYIYSIAIEAATSPSSPALLWKILAYAYGWEIFRNVYQLGEISSDFKRRLAAWGDSEELRKALMAAVLEPVTSATSADILERLSRMRKEAPSAAESLEAAKQLVQQLGAKFELTG